MKRFDCFLLTALITGNCLVQTFAQAPSPATVGPVIDSAPVGDVGGKHQLTPDARAKAIETLLRFDDFPKYDFLLLNIPIESKENLLQTTKKVGGELRYQSPSTSNERAGFAIFTPEAFHPKGRSVFAVPSPRLERFVKANGVDDVPIAVARGLADAFLSGLVANLYLHRYCSAADLKLPILEKGLVSRYNGPTGKERQSFAGFQNPKNFGYTPKRPITEEMFTKHLGTMLRKANVQPIGILYGWQCADDMRKAGNAQELDDAVFALVRSRFTARQTAKIAAYAISFLEGWSRGTSEIQQGRPRIYSADTILEELSSQNAANEQRLCELLFKDMLTSYSMAVLKDRDCAETRILRDCVEGFYEGTVSASDELFQVAYDLGFDAGYQKGFKEGYAAGYSAGRSSAEPEGSVATNLLSAFKMSKDPIKTILNGAESVGKAIGMDVGPIKRPVEQILDFGKKLLKKIF
jgi:hypothetical protein